MLSQADVEVNRDVSRRRGPKRTRTLQRRLHLLTGFVVVVYIYAAPELGAAATAGVRWLVLPVLVISGVVMWQWPRLRRLAHRRRVSP